MNERTIIEKLVGKEVAIWLGDKIIDKDDNPVDYTHVGKIMSIEDDEWIRLKCTTKKTNLPFYKLINIHFIAYIIYSNKSIDKVINADSKTLVELKISNNKRRI
jgi:hypothetical protein